MTTISLRLASIDDAQLIADLTRACWLNTVAANSAGHQESAEKVKSHLQHGGGFILLEQQQPIGSVRWLRSAATPDMMELARMGLLPAWRGKNLATYLLQAVLEQAQRDNVNELRLAIRSDQPRLLDFYAGFGFKLAPDLNYSHANPLLPAPFVMRRSIDAATRFR
jgi:GNAT superfamily N-acetyltransferase